MRTYTKEEKQAVIDRVISGELSDAYPRRHRHTQEYILRLVTSLPRGTGTPITEGQVRYPQFPFARKQGRTFGEHR